MSETVSVEKLFETAGVDKASPAVITRQVEVLKANVEAVMDTFIAQTSTIELLIDLEKKASDAGKHTEAAEYKKRKDALFVEAAANAKTIEVAKARITQFEAAIPK